MAALLPDLLVFRKPRGPEPELATAQGVLLGVHVTGEGWSVALPPCQRGGYRLGLWRAKARPDGCRCRFLGKPGRSF